MAFSYGDGDADIARCRFRSRWLGVPIWASILFLSGCATFRSEPLDSEQKLISLEHRGLWDAGLCAFIARQKGESVPMNSAHAWTSEELVLAAFYFQPTLRVARERWAIAQAEVIAAGERPNPTLGFIPGYNTTLANPTPWLPALTFDIPIETAGKRTHRREQARHLEGASRLDFSTAAWQTRGRVRDGMLGLYAAREREVLSRRQQELQTEYVALQESRYAAGAISSFEVMCARLSLNTIRLAWLDARQKVAEAQAGLAAAIGLSTRALDQVVFSFADMKCFPAEPPPAVARRQALLRRTDVLSALAEYEAAQSALRLEVARQYPDLHLGPGYEYDQGDNKWSLGLSFTLPLLNQNQGAIATARAKRAAAAATFTALQAAVLAELDRALAMYDGGLKKCAEADMLMREADARVRVSRERFQAGDLSRNDLIELELQAIAAAIDHLDVLVQAQQALGSLEDALQSPLNWPSTVWLAEDLVNATPNTMDK